MRIGRYAVAVLGLAVFAAGYALGRRSALQAPAAPPTGYEIREGRGGFLNPLLDCEISEGRVFPQLRTFGSELDALVDSLEADPQVERIAIYFRDLNNGPWLGHQEQEGFIPASLAKMPVLVACLRQAEAAPSFLARTVVYQGLEEERESGFMNPEVNLERGQIYTVRELIRRVAVYSDNAAARLLAKLIDPHVLATVNFDLGFAEQPTTEPRLRLSPKEYGSLFRVLYNASYLDRSLSALLLEDLSRSTFELGLVAGVPESVVVSHKFGVWEGLVPDSPAPLQLHDCGIVYHPASPYLLCVMTSGTNYVRMSSAIAEVSRLVYRQVDRPRTSAGAARS